MNLTKKNMPITELENEKSKFFFFSLKYVDKSFQ